MLVDFTLLADVLKGLPFYGELAEPVVCVVHHQLVVWALEALNLIIHLVILLKEQERGVNLHEPRLDCHEQREVLSEHVSAFEFGLDAHETLIIREEFFESRDNSSVQFGVDIHPDLIPEIAKLRTNLLVVCYDPFFVILIWLLS